MKAIKLANLILLISGLALTGLGITLLLYDAASERDNFTFRMLEWPDTDDEWLAQGKLLVQQHNCNFCHRTEKPTDAAHLARDNCQQCHQYKDRPENLAPPLDSIGERRTEDWIRRYLRYPYPIRQNSGDRMPDLGLPDREVEILTRYLLLRAADGIESLPDWRPAREAEPDAARLAGGRALWDKFNCAQCHSLGEQVVKPTYNERGQPHLMPVVFAPALDMAWTRTRPEWLAEGIQHPNQRLAWSGMFQTTMTQAEARELAWYVTNAVPSPKSRVSAGEVVDLLRRRCNGCHYGPDKNAPASANPAGGAGWTAVWGKARKLDLMSIEGLMKGAVDDLDNARPVAVGYAPNSPLLMHVKGLKHPSMPFGMDPLPPEEIRLIEDWIMAGAPTPTSQGGIKVNPPIELGD